MNLIDEQITQMRPLEHVLNAYVRVIVIGDDVRNALESLQNQVYRNFNVSMINDRVYIEKDGAQIELQSNLEKLKKIIFNVKEKYVYLIDGEDVLPPNALLEYVRYAEDGKTDFFYANEAIRYDPRGRWPEYQIKPFPTKIAIFQSLHMGKAFFWKLVVLQDIIDLATDNNLSVLGTELMLNAIYQGYRVGFLPQILLIKQRNNRNFNAEKCLISLLQKNINKYTEWSGKLGKTVAYNLNGVELYNKEINDLFDKIGFIIIEECLERTLQLLSQISVSYYGNEIIIATYEGDLKQVEEYCKNNNLFNAKIIFKDAPYAKMLEKMTFMLKSSIQIILNDQVQWINRMNIERLVKSFLKPEVMLAVPQVATEGDNPVLIYAGAGINNLSLNGSYFRGRLQRYQGEQDMVWTNYEVSMLTPYCIAARKVVWKELFPLHKSVITEQHFANEISLICLRKKIICEYAAQSSVWVSKEIGEFYHRSPNTSQINIGDTTREPRLSGNYWHTLCDYSDLIEERVGDIPYLLRSYNQFQQEEFMASGLSNIKNKSSQRVLVLTHELSLTGAPLVLVQAVNVLIKNGFDILIVSPKDGPLRKKYLEMNIPVIIEPELQNNFEYLRIAYDFHFVFVSTVVLWECIEALGYTDIPVLWWVHDSRIGYENYLRYVLPETIGENIHLYCGGDYAYKVITEYRPKYRGQILLYGIQDFSTEVETITRAAWGLPEDKVIFATVGQITQRKGQDIFVRAIRLLPIRILEKCVFVFIGTVQDRKIYREIESLKECYPHNIFYIEQLSYDKLKSFYAVIDCIVCASKDDPLPAFVAEALLMSCVCICSRNTAFNSLITSGEDGYLFESGNVKELCEKICWVAREIDELGDMRKKARKLYESRFTPELFERNFLDLVYTKLIN